MQPGCASLMWEVAPEPAMFEPGASLGAFALSGKVGD